MTSFPITGTPRLRVSVPAGSVSITAVDGATETTVELTPTDRGQDTAARLLEHARVAADGDTVIVEVPGDRGLFRSRVPAVDCVIRTATGAVLDVRVASADVEVRGSVGDTRLATASGDVEVDRVSGRVDASGASGDFTLGVVSGDLSVTTASGNVEVAEVGGAASIKTASGDAEVSRSRGPVRHTSASGDFTLRSASGPTVTAQTMSGDVVVGVEHGVTAWLDLSAVSGRVSSDLPVSDERPADTGDPLTLRVRTVSGDISVQRAHPATAGV